MNLHVNKEDRFDEVFDTQKNFRVLLDAMSRPGRIYRLYGNSFNSCPEGFNPHVLTILKTLCDNNVTFTCSNVHFTEYIAVNSGASPVESVETADYAVFSGTDYSSRYMVLKTGSHEFPEDSATAIITVDRLADSVDDEKHKKSVKVNLSGPGIKDRHFLAIDGLDKEYLEDFKSLNMNFPLGMDLILVDTEGSISCMTRTTAQEVV